MKMWFLCRQLIVTMTTDTFGIAKIAEKSIMRGLPSLRLLKRQQRQIDTLLRMRLPGVPNWWRVEMAIESSLLFDQTQGKISQNNWCSIREPRIMNSISLASVVFTVQVENFVTTRLSDCCIVFFWERGKNRVVCEFCVWSKDSWR